MRINKYSILDVNTPGRFQLDGCPISHGTIRLSGGVDMYINRPLFQNLGTTIIGSGGATIELRMPYNTAGTIDQLSYHGAPPAESSWMAVPCTCSAARSWTARSSG